MEEGGMTLEGLRHALAALESRQRAVGSTVTDFFTRPYAAGPPTETPRSSSGSKVRVGWRLTEIEGDLARSVAFGAAVVNGCTTQTSGLSEKDLVETVVQLGRLEEAKEVMLVRVVTELEARGVDSPGGLSRVDWLRSVDSTLTGPQAKAITTAAKAFTQPRWQALASAVTGSDGSASAVTVGKAAQVVEFLDRLGKVADPDELDRAVDHLSEQAATLRPEELAQLARLLGDQVRPPQHRGDHDRARRESRGLWWMTPNASGMVGMRAVLDPEGAAVVKAALDPLSAPRPLTDDSGRVVEPDTRRPHQRRADALIEIIGRGVSSPGAPPSTDKAKINVTIDYDALADLVRNTDGVRTTSTGERGSSGRSRGPGAGGVCLSGDILSPATVRRLACDAAIIPVVLGSLGQPLDVGREERLVTRAMRTLLWLRDGGCSFPGCSVRAQWCDAHHVIHWLHGGETCVPNLALLCRRHHTHVHERNLTATVTETGVTWHTWQQWKLDHAPPRGADQSGPASPLVVGLRAPDQGRSP